MTEVRAGVARPARLLHALAGERVEPPACGVSFVDPRLLGDAGEAAVPDGGAAALARGCVRERLDFAFVPSWEPWALEACAALADAGVGAAWVVPGVLWPALEEAGVPAGLRAAAAGPDAVAPLLDGALRAALAAVAAGVEARAVAIVVADDLAGSAGPLLDPAFLTAAVFPRLARLVDAARAAGLPAVLHCDGDAWALMGEAAAAGFVAVHGDAGGARGIEGALAAARAAGLALIGGVPTAALASDEEARAAGERALELASRGGLLAADDGGVTSAHEVRALLVALRIVGEGR